MRGQDAGELLANACACSLLLDVLGEPAAIYRADRESLDPRLIATEEALAETMIEAWEARTGVVMAETRQLVAQGALDTVAAVETYLASLTAELGTGVAAETSLAMQSAMESAFMLGRSNVFQGGAADVLLTTADRNAQAWLSNHHTFWVREHYSAHVSGRVADSVRAAVVEQGYSPALVGRQLQESLGHQLGVQGSESYWRGVAQNASTTATNFGRVSSFEQAGAESFRIVNPTDKDTSPVCNYMHGVVFGVQAGADQRDAMMAASSPEDVKSIHRWTTIKELRRIGGPNGGAAADSAALVAAGICMPPLHFHCRSYTVANSFSDLTALL
jgi:hypothetical protein